MRRWPTVCGIAAAMLLTLSTAAVAAPAPPDPPGPTAPEQRPGQAGRSAGHETSAAAAFGWGEPNRADEFDGPLGEEWNVYDGPGHADNGRRTPDAVSIQDGILTITGDPEGNTAGMAWGEGQKYGRWEGRVRAPASDESYNALLLLWPDAEDFPVGGEIDFMEMMDHTRQTTNIFLHFGEDNDQVVGEVQIDATQWHNWAVEWTPDHVAAFVDGEEWWRTEDTQILPPRAMHLCVQLDWFPEDGDGEVQESAMHVDWVKRYPLDEGQQSEPSDEAVESSAVPGSARRAPSDPDAATRVEGRVTEGVPDPATR
ncbi:glycoside hydrolase family 16 protein [Pseudonocardia sp. MH-G8]|uniref:glycoside hydrolase family 16 protein n=1 Tax=Pseudonocardia sp. MH-G8 TaxID=1854588 RepID=UPI000B9FC2C2|nr:glycoside hydrolase family 16 protein [Pseudonocardia sp. MH-G8]OZM81576.1 glycoside hydrolase [Pseudonocardia sp. MH-G8]